MRMKSYLFWPVWSAGVAVYLAAWTYGEMSTLNHVEGSYGPLVWIISLVLGIGLAVALSRRIFDM